MSNKNITIVVNLAELLRDAKSEVLRIIKVQEDIKSFIKQIDLEDYSEDNVNLTNNIANEKIKLENIDKELKNAKEYVITLEKRILYIIHY